ncbi:hypothetical protein [Desulfosporosinus sp. OT]|nr:hypothetical protein [Desulfosporosinus sp. OT]EGW37695.1 hypothetical protein DOT_4436 [Desulfosporosinus sp. OT]
MTEREKQIAEAILASVGLESLQKSDGISPDEANDTFTISTISRGA